MPAMLKPNDLKWVPLTDHAVIPTKRDEDAAYDLYACFVEDFVLIDTLENDLIPTGIASVMHHTKQGTICERGKTGKSNMGIGAGLIDSGYRGEWFVMIRNYNDRPLVLSKIPLEEVLRKIEEYYHLDSITEDQIVYFNVEKAIAQVKIQDVPRMQVEVITKEEMMKYDSERGAGKIGDSGK